MSTVPSSFVCAGRINLYDAPSMVTVFSFVHPIKTKQTTNNDKIIFFFIYNNIYKLIMTLYEKFTLLKEEINRHKWIESEKINKDIGFENALIDWLLLHRKNWIFLKALDKKPEPVNLEQDKNKEH